VGRIPWLSVTGAAVKLRYQPAVSAVFQLGFVPTDEEMDHGAEDSRHTVRLSSNTLRECGLLCSAAWCHKPTYAVQQKSALFDHLIGADKQSGWHSKAE
jgi:hypothetical protein